MAKRSKSASPKSQPASKGPQSRGSLLSGEGTKRKQSRTADKEKVKRASESRQRPISTLRERVAHLKDDDGNPDVQDQQPERKD